MANHCDRIEIELRSNCDRSLHVSSNLMSILLPLQKNLQATFVYKLQVPIQRTTPRMKAKCTRVPINTNAGRYKHWASASETNAKAGNAKHKAHQWVDLNSTSIRPEFDLNDFLIYAVNSQFSALPGGAIHEYWS